MPVTVKLGASAERRPLTILHCDLVNSTQLVDRLDPEEFLGVVERFLDMTTEVVEEFHGTVASFTGDGIEAYFGYPVTTETPAADAIFAALRIRNSLISNQLNSPVQLQCRIGVATGIAVVGHSQSGDHGRRLMAFGSVAHLAQRLQSAAEPDQVFIDLETRKLASQSFTFLDVGPSQLKGFEADVEISEVVGLLAGASRFDFSAHNLVPIAGRKHVLDVLDDRWQVVLEGEGQVVHLVGDAGIGKSRALHEFEESIAARRIRTYRLQCSSQYTSTPLHPWVHYIPVLAKFRQTDTVEQRREKTRLYLSDGLNLSDRLVELGMSLIGNDERAVFSAAMVPPTAALFELNRALINVLVEESREKPVLVLFEDIQWIDATSSSWLDMLNELVAEESIFVCVTSRPGATSSSTNSHTTVLSLVKLSAAEVRQLINRLIEQAGGSLSEEIIEQIVDRSEGNPLYIEELTAMFLQSANMPDNSSLIGLHMQVPLTLQMSLLARVDRIEHGRELAEIAAVIGDSFTVAQMENLSKHSTDGVSVGLSALVSSNVLRRTEQNDILLYEFRHSLLQDAIYASLLNAKREQIHAKIARDLKNQTDIDNRQVPELIAYHFDSANDSSGAFDHCVLAGERALRAGATSEAIDFLERAYKYIDVVSQNRKHLPQLQHMHMAYGMAINAVHGAVADPGVQFKLASEIGEQLDNIELTVEALDWQFGVAFNAGQIDLCTQPAERLIEIGKDSDNPLPFVAGSQALGMVYFNQGRFEDAVNRFDLLFAREPELVSGQHCYPSLALSYFSWSKCMLGDRKASFELAECAIASSRGESAHAYTIALSNCSYVYHSLGDYELLERCNRELNDHCEATGEFMYSLRAKAMRDYLLTKQIQTAEYLPSIAEKLTALLDAKEEVELTYLYALLADAQIGLELYSNARESLLTGIEIANRNGEMFCYAQLNSMMAIVVEHYSEKSFNNLGPVYYLDQAILVASQQGAKKWEEEARQSRMAVESRFEGVDNGMH